MGRLYYGSSLDPIEMPDRVLAHVKTVAATKLRRLESFTLTWTYGTEHEGGRSTVWLHCSIPLRFDFDTLEAQQLDRDYLQELAQAASSSAGIVLDLTENLTAIAEPVVLATELVRAA
ncbi:hypothetical protein ACFQRL_10315 [Microbacterium fluvii]|uniref:DUF7882 domain-containing protein n=1 Tax=Microbacterium fluvii TaxID=415215 RepID=A0ABW2HE10_9MICO|nr:hypothetical protein [Microbacterium fluvii]MCU4672987.1 hypothetical protein [Microbacterium fluvii]